MPAGVFVQQMCIEHFCAQNFDKNSGKCKEIPQCSGWIRVQFYTVIQNANQCRNYIGCGIQPKVLIWIKWAGKASEVVKFELTLKVWAGFWLGAYKKYGGRTLIECRSTKNTQRWQTIRMAQGYKQSCLSRVEYVGKG